MSYSTVKLARNELLRAALSVIQDESYHDDFPERDASGGESLAMAEESLQEKAKEYLSAVEEDKT